MSTQRPSANPAGSTGSGSPAPAASRRRAGSTALRVGAALAAPTLFLAVVAAPVANAVVPTDEASDGLVAEAQGQNLHSADSRYDPLVVEVGFVEEEPTPKTVKSKALFTLSQFMSKGAVNWGGYRFTYYSQQVLPGTGLAIPGRHVSESGYVSDEDGYIVLAGSAPKGTVYETPFGAPGKIYDRGTFGNHLDVYIQ